MNLHQVIHEYLRLYREQSRAAADQFLTDTGVALCLRKHIRGCAGK
ncbi:MAG: hypothetical protein PHH26_08195 [Candidatus Thermoplasmatota archaeon]|nr:hypothetical protein [Candidatus Thermoplasmatota archaeon]